MTQERPDHISAASHGIQAALAESERRFELAMAHAPIGMALVDNDDRCLRANPALGRMLGYEPHEIVGDDLLGRVHPDDLAPTRAALARLFGGSEEAVRLERRMLHRAGHVVETQTDIAVVRDAQGRVLYRILQIQDIGERKRAERVLRAAEDRFRSLYEHSLEAMFITSPDGRILSANPAACDLFGRTEAEIVALGRAGVLDTADPRLAEMLARRAGDGWARGVLRFVRADSSRFEGEVSTAVFRTADGELLTSLTVRDLTALKQALEGLARRTIELQHAEELSRLKDAFLSTVSHEIKTPLTLIAGYLELFEERYPEDELVAGMRDGTRRLVEHISRILDYSGLLSGRATPYRVAMEPAELVGLALERADARTRAVEVTLPASGRPWLVDPRWFSLAMAELLANAVRFSPADGEIALTLEDRDDGCVVDVCDHGPGVPTEAHQRMLEPFSQLESEDSRRRGGLGLGLAIARLVAEQHGGRLTLTTLDGGMCARLELPWEG